MSMRIVRYQLPAVAAGATSGPVGVSSFDDRMARRLTGIKVTNNSKLVRIVIDVVGRVFIDLDCGATNTAEGFIPLDQTFPPGVLFSVDVRNSSAGAVAANTDAVILRYEADSIQ